MLLNGGEQIRLILLEPEPHQLDRIPFRRFRQQGDLSDGNTRRALLEHGDDVGLIVAQVGSQLPLGLPGSVDQRFDALDDQRR